MTHENDIERLFRSNYKSMLTFAIRLVHDGDVARDIVHDVFASLLSGDNRCVTSAYLMQGVKFACLKHLRTLGALDRMNRLYALYYQDVADGNWPDEAVIARMRTVIDTQLTEQCRKVVTLRFMSCLSYKEIADELSISEVAVYKHLRRALVVLRQNLNEYER